MRNILPVYLLLATSYWLLAPIPLVHAQIPSPLKEDLRREIIGAGQQAAVVGIGQQTLEDVDIRLYAMRILRGALGLVGLTLIIFILYGGFMYMTSQGNEEKLGAAKKILTRAAVGAAIILSSYAVTVMLTRRIVRLTFEVTLRQAQSCSTGTGQLTCCEEWNAYQNIQSEIPALIPQEGGQSISEQEESRDDRLTEAYRNWQECREREEEAAGL